jgi:uridine kinase
MAYPAMEERVDLVGYIDASPETRLARRIARDGSERGYTEDEVRYQWKNHVRPADIQFIEPWKIKADVVVDNEKDWKSGLNELIDKMKKA